MENKLAKYGVKKPISRPKIKPTKQLNLDTPEGQRPGQERERFLSIHD